MAGSREPDEYDLAGANWARGMRLAAEYTRRRREAAQAIAVAHRGTVPRCGVKGCTRSGGRRGICPAHYELVPMMAKVDAHISILRAQLEATRRAHRELVRIAQRRVDELSLEDWRRDTAALTPVLRAQRPQERRRARAAAADTQTAPRVTKRRTAAGTASERR